MRTQLAARGCSSARLQAPASAPVLCPRSSLLVANAAYDVAHTAWTPMSGPLPLSASVNSALRCRRSPMRLQCAAKDSSHSSGTQLPHQGLDSDGEEDTGPGPAAGYAPPYYYAQSRRSPLNLEVMGRQAGTLLRRGQQRAWEDLHKPAGMIMFPAWLLGACAGILDLPVPMHYVSVATGLGIGVVFALLNRHCNVRRFIAPPQPMAVVLTGGSKGLGKALARELLLGGDRVMLTSRSQSGADETVNQLKEELGDDVDVHGVACDVSNPEDVARLEAAAVERFGTVDVWINNAAYSGSFQPFVTTESDQLMQVVRTNLLGVTLCSRQAARLFLRQASGGHLFNIDGAGADGFPTPNYAAYGATKAGIRQLSVTLQQELRHTDTRVHLLSPGMILTDLLLEGATPANKQAFNILCEQPETTAAFLGPRIRSVVARGLRDTYVRYLTPTSALWRFLTAPSRVGRYFDAEGNPVYPPERERMYGRGAKATARRIAAARRQNQGLQLAYSLTLTVSVALLLLEASLSAGGASATNLIQ